MRRFGGAEYAFTRILSYVRWMKPTHRLKSFSWTFERSVILFIFQLFNLFITIHPDFWHSYRSLFIKYVTIIKPLIDEGEIVCVGANKDRRYLKGKDEK